MLAEVALPLARNRQAAGSANALKHLMSGRGSIPAVLWLEGRYRHHVTGPFDVSPISVIILIVIIVLSLPLTLCLFPPVCLFFLCTSNPESI